jgi:hypothetical protein
MMPDIREADGVQCLPISHVLLLQIQDLPSVSWLAYGHCRKDTLDPGSLLWSAHHGRGA